MRLSNGFLNSGAEVPAGLLNVLPLPYAAAFLPVVGETAGLEPLAPVLLRLTYLSPRLTLEPEAWNVLEGVLPATAACWTLEPPEREAVLPLTVDIEGAEAPCLPPVRTEPVEAAS